MFTAFLLQFTINRNFKSCDLKKKGQITARMKFSVSLCLKLPYRIKNVVLHPPFIYTPWKKLVPESFELSLSHLGLVCQELVRQDCSCDYQECQWGKESSNPPHLSKQNTVLKAISAGASFIPFHLKSWGFSVWAPPKQRAQPCFGSGGDPHLSWAKRSNSCVLFLSDLLTNWCVSRLKQCADAL